MKPQFTKDGIEIQTFDEIFNELVAEYKSIYGEGIDLDQNTPDGQKIGIEAKLAIDLQTFALALATARDPDFAEGNNLNSIAKICGITRKPATQSSVVMTVTTDRNLTLPVGFTVQDETNQNWKLETATSCTTGDNTITFYAENYGDVEAEANTITTIITVVLGVTAVTNAAAATSGQDEETDEEFRARRNLSLENPSYSTVGSLFSKLANLKNVTDVRVYENVQDTSDPEKNMPPHSIWIVIDGGAEADIAETTAKNKTAGTAMKGNTTTDWIETLILPNDITYEIVHTIRYDRPTAKDLYIRLNVEKKVPTQSIDIQLIKNKLVTQKYVIGQDAQANELYSFVYQAGTNFIATDLEISDDNAIWTSGDLQAGYDEILTITDANITVTEIV